MSQRTKANYKTTIDGAITTNGTGAITGSVANGIFTDTVDSAMFISDNFIDEDSFATDSATMAPSQQSTKAYIASQISIGTINDTDVKYFEQNDWVVQGGVGPEGWVISGSIGSTIYGENSTENVLGACNLPTGTSTSGLSAASKIRFFISYGSTIKIRSRIAVPNLSDGTNTYTIYFGLAGTIGSGNPSNGVFFRYTHSVNSGKFQQVTRASGTETANDTGITVDTTYKILEIQINSAGTSVSFFIDGIQTGSPHTTNIPTGVSLSMFYKIEKSAGTTSRDLDIDWHDILITRSSAR